MMKRYGVGLLAITVCMALVVQPVSAFPRSKDADTLYKELELFTDALSYIKEDYVEEVESKDLIYGALKGLLVSLDPYSQFMDPDTYQEIKVETEGEFGGLGIEITVKDELLTIITPLDDTPASRAGLAAGDKIVKIDGELTKGIALVDAVKKLRGKPGTDVELMVLREEEQKLLEFTITRDIIKLESVRNARVLEAGIGYVRISEFQEKTPADLEAALKEISAEEPLKGLILDVRNNPGGLLDVSIDIAALFLQKGLLVVETRGRREGQNRKYNAANGAKYLDFPMVVLVNGGSASASEIVAGALKDHRRAVVLGTKTFGKGSVQTVIPLQDGSALRLTTSKYYTPSGISIHGEGIEPDIVVEYKAVEDNDAEESHSAEVFRKVENGFDDEEAKTEGTEEDEKAEEEKEDTFVMDNQVVRAIDLLKGLNILK